MAILPLILAEGTTAYAGDVMSLFYEIYGNIDASNVQAANKTGTGKFVLDTSPTISAPLFTGDVNFDSGTLFVDATNNRVYIGATSSAMAQDFQVTRSFAGGNLAALVYNSETANAASNAILSTQVGGASAGDPYFIYTVTGISAWSTGLDNSDSDKYKISFSSALGTNDRFTLDSSGNSNFSGTATSTQFTSTIATGTAPLVVSSTTKVANLNAEFLNGYNSDRVAKSWGEISGAGSVISGINIASASKISTGKYEINFTDAMSAGYIVTFGTIGNPAGTAIIPKVFAKTTTKLTVATYDTSSVLTDSDFNFIVMST